MQVAMQEKVRESIQKAARICFLRHGYVETTIRDIAGGAGVSPATIYNYFESKKALFDSLDIPEMEQVRPEYQKKMDQALKAALVLFGEKGLEGATMDEIAGRAGISKATLYQYCDGKEDLFARVLQESAFNTFSKRAKTELINVGWEQAVKEIGRSYLKISTQPERIAIFRAVIRDSAKYPEIGVLYYERGFKAACDDVIHFLKTAREAGAPIKDVDLMGAVQTYFGSLQSFILMKSVISGVRMKITAEDYLDISTDLFLNGLKE